jgi:AcrR family transcriptional regulator
MQKNAALVDRIPLPRQRLPATLRRAQIIDVAKQLFADGGLAAISMRALAAKLAITPAAIYQHFADKEAILVHIATAYFENFMVALNLAKAGPEAPLDKFQAAMKTAIEFGLAHPIEYRLVFMTPILDGAMAHRHRPGQSEDIKISSGIEAFGTLIAAISELIDAGLIDPGDPDQLAENVWAACHGLISLLITHPSFPFTDQKRLIAGHVRIMVQGLGAKLPPVLRADHPEIP